jgi:two-component system, NarL family, nitrate/nitrite response regulator NarL
MSGDLNSIRVVIADERVTFRNSLRTLLGSDPDLAIVGEASEARTIPALSRQLKPDVVVIDIALFSRLKGKAGRRPAFKTLVTVPTFERADIITAFLRGARAVVSKPSPAHVWRESIRAVGAGQFWLVNESMAMLVQALRDSLPHEAEAKSQNDYKLTPREAEIMDKIAQGHSNKEVGQAFSICERTVKHHLTSIFTKVGVSSRLELGLFALNNRLAESASHRDVKLGDGERSTALDSDRRAIVGQ